jgi:hypothetical protein
VRRGEFSKKSGASAFLHFACKLVHRLSRDNPAFVTGEGSHGIVERQKKFRPLPLAFFPQSKGLLQASCSECSRPLSIARRAKAFLILAKVYVHQLQNRENLTMRQRLINSARGGADFLCLRKA